MNVLKKIKWILFLNLVVGCSDSIEPEHTLKSNVRAVKTYLVNPQKISTDFTYSATIDVKELTPLSFEVPGKTKEISLRVGQKVTKGQILAELDDRDYDLQLSQAKATLLEAEIALEQASIEESRHKSLFDKELVSKSLYDKIKNQKLQAEARVSQAKGHTKLIEKKYLDTKLFAPFDGVINKVEIEDFTNIKAGEVIVSMYKDDYFELSFFVPYSVVKSLSVEDGVSIILPDVPNRELKGTISEIGLRAETATAFPVTVKVEDTTTDIRAGQSALVKIKVENDSANQGVTIPITSLITNEIGQFKNKPYLSYVFIFKPLSDEYGILEKREVIISSALEESVVVTKGLDENELIVVAGVPFLHEGQKVKLYKSKSFGGE